MTASSSSATVAVEKATSDLLMGPDWTMNIEICVPSILIIGNLQLQEKEGDR